MAPIDTVLQKGHSSYQKYHLAKMAPNINGISQKWYPTTRISLPIGTNGRQLLVNFPMPLVNWWLVKHWLLMERKLPMLWLVMMHWQYIGNHWWTGYVNHWVRLVMTGKKLVPQIRIISCYNNNGQYSKKDENDWKIVDKQLAMIIT